MDRAYSLPQDAMTGLEDPKTPPDEELMRELASGRQEAIGPLYARYGRLLFGMAVQALDRPAAEVAVLDKANEWSQAFWNVPQNAPAEEWIDAGEA